MKECNYCKKEFTNLGVHQRACKSKPTNSLNYNATNERAIVKEKFPVELKPPTTSTISATDAKLDQVISGINTLANAVTKLVEKQAKPELEAIRPEESETKATDVPDIAEYDPKKDETINNTYIPPRYRKIVDEVLSSDFGLRLQDFEDRLEFQVDIIVPEKYSSIPAEDRQKGAEDIRTKIIPRALGENGIREWCKLVRMNLNKYFTQQGIQSPFSNLKELV